jgi:heme O synthase-like polyprenyltransferase
VAAKATFLWSLVYLALLFTAMGVDRALAAA